MDPMFHFNFKSWESLIHYGEERNKRIGEFFRSDEAAKNLLQRKLSQVKCADSEYQQYLDKNGEERDCQCQSCREEKDNFDNLRELPLLPVASEEVERGE